MGSATYDLLQTDSSVFNAHHGGRSPSGKTAMVAQHAGRRGRRWRKVKDDLHRTSQMCWLCGHAGAFEADHEPSRKVLLALGLDPNDPQYVRPAHGSSCPCPTCGQKCNQVKGSGGRRPRMTCEW